MIVDLAFARRRVSPFLGSLYVLDQRLYELLEKINHLMRLQESCVVLQDNICSLPAISSDALVRQVTLLWVMKRKEALEEDFFHKLMLLEDLHNPLFLLFEAW
jgi:hypothetical protein